MTPQQREKLSQEIEQGLQLLWGITFLAFPVFFATFTTDIYILPKELLLGTIVLVSLLAWGVKMLLDGQVRISRTPLDVPVLLFGLALLLSSLFAVDRVDSLVSVVPALFIFFSFFVITNTLKAKQAGLFLVSCLVTGGIFTTLVTVAAHFKLYIFPFVSTHTTTFSPLGSQIDFLLYIVLLLPLTIHFVLPALKQQLTARVGIFAVAGLVLVAGIVGIGSILIKTPPLLLPFDTGFQTAFAAISQDAGRLLQGFFFGSGYGTFSTDFTRFHLPTFNANNQLWYLSFGSSSSYVLELLATTGLVGILTYIFLLIRALTPIERKKHNPLYFSLIAFIILSFLLPFTYPIVALFFFFLAVFTLFQRHVTPDAYFDIELKFVALKKGVLTFTNLEDVTHSKKDNHPTPLFAFIALLVLVVVLGYYTTTFAISNATFAQSLSAANSNNGTLTYRLQSQAITTFPYLSAYYRIFSQTNIALANSLLALQSGKNSSPSAATQQTAFTLVQQAITTARQATSLAPEDVLEWQNLASVYRSLIGLGQNADSFALESSQQAVLLDPSNPQEYLTLGGLYYQLGQFDSAISAFQKVISLKQDYPNGYYNLGHAYEQKQDYQDALSNFEIVKQLVVNNGQNEQQINQEIAAVQAKIGSSGNQQTQQNAPQALPKTPTISQEPLNVNGQPQAGQSGTPSEQPVPTYPNQIPLMTPTPSK